MAQNHEGEMEYGADDNEMAEAENDSYIHRRVVGGSDSEDDDDDQYDPLVCFESYAKSLL